MDGMTDYTAPVEPVSLDLPAGNEESTDPLLACCQLEAVVEMINEAKATQGQPGGKANLVAAEVAAGLFVAKFHVLLRDGLRKLP